MDGKWTASIAELLAAHKLRDPTQGCMSVHARLVVPNRGLGPRKYVEFFHRVTEKVLLDVAKANLKNFLRFKPGRDIVDDTDRIKLYRHNADALCCSNYYRNQLRMMLPLAASVEVYCETCSRQTPLQSHILCTAHLDYTGDGQETFYHLDMKEFAGNRPRTCPRCGACRVPGCMNFNCKCSMPGDEGYVNPIVQQFNGAIHTTTQLVRCLLATDEEVVERSDKLVWQVDELITSLMACCELSILLPSIGRTVFPQEDEESSAPKRSCRDFATKSEGEMVTALEDAINFEFSSDTDKCVARLEDCLVALLKDVRRNRVLPPRRNLLATRFLDVSRF